jgi:DNA-binding beta-propeller fold protein YncE
MYETTPITHISAPRQLLRGPIGNDLVANALAAAPRSISDGNVKLTPVADMIRLPAGHEEFVMDYHGVACDSLGRVYVLYNSMQRFAHTRALARFHYVFDDDSNRGFCVFDTFLGTRSLAEGTPHGLNVASIGRGGDSPDEGLLIVNVEGTVSLLDLDGNVFWTRSLSNDGSMKPTSAAIDRNSGIVGVVDGYGTNTNLILESAHGEIICRTGAKGDGDGQSTTNHGIDVDPDGYFVVADRGNTRLTWWHSDTFEPVLVDGRQRKVDMPGLQVCSLSFFMDWAVVPCLNSKLAFLQRDIATSTDYKIVAVVQIPEELIQIGIDGIHDAAFTPDGRYIIVGVWERRRAERQLPTLTAFRFELLN